MDDNVIRLAAEIWDNRLYMDRKVKICRELFRKNLLSSVGFEKTVFARFDAIKDATQVLIVQALHEEIKQVHSESR